MKIRIMRSAGPRTMWDPQTFDKALNIPIPLQHNGLRLGTAYLRSATYTHNYRTAILLIEVTE